MMVLDRSSKAATALYVSRAGVDVREPPGFLVNRPHGSGDYDFLCFASPVEMVLRGRRERLESGACVLYGPRSAQWYSGGTSAFTHHWFHFDGSQAEALVRRCALPHDTPFYPRDTRLIGEVVRAICIEQLQQQAGWEDAVAAHVVSLLVQLRRRLQPSGETVANNAIVHHRLGEIRYTVQQHPERPWSVGEMASRAYLSRSRFSALYRRLFGISPMEDVIAVRLQRARWLLENSTLTVKQIASETGFRDDAYFNRLFQRKLGTTPGHYRRR
jgi:AraC-like DNA-binding protein